MKFRHKFPRGTFTGLIALIILVGFSFSRPGERLFDIAKNLDLYASVFKELNKFYVDDVNPNLAVKTSIDALLKSFDPYTVYYPEDELEDFMTMTTGKYQGIGIVLTEIDHDYQVAYVDENSPASKAGLGIGDQLISVNGIKISVTPEAEPFKLLKGQAGTSLDISVLKIGESSPRTIRLNRETVQIKNVNFAGIIRPEVGYISLEEFNASATKELKASLNTLKQAGMRKLILDLRDNPGGLLTQAVDICNLFLAKETKIVETRGKVEEWNKTYAALNASFDSEIPLIILINGHSASAAEIVAGVMQDYDRAVLIGKKSYGKGLVQVTRDLPYRTKMKITTAKYYIPSGRCIQAIDYQHKNPDGQALAYKDSSIKTFKTQNGRNVVDGGGILPDILIGKDPHSSSFTQALMKQHMIFLYACYYQKNHPKIASAETFIFTENDLMDFQNWLKNQKFSFESPIEKQVKLAIELAKKDNAYASLETGLTALKMEWSSSASREFLAHKQEITTLIEQEIVLHYYLQKGLNQWSFSKDPAILESLYLFNQPQKFQALLANKK
jgi:carboxyl-terminal processing protease